MLRDVDSFVGGSRLYSTNKKKVDFLDPTEFSAMNLFLPTLGNIYGEKKARHVSRHQANNRIVA